MRVATLFTLYIQYSYILTIRLWYAVSYVPVMSKSRDNVKDKMLDLFLLQTKRN